MPEETEIHKSILAGNYLLATRTFLGGPVLVLKVSNSAGRRLSYIYLDPSDVDTLIKDLQEIRKELGVSGSTQYSSWFTTNREEENRG